MPKYIVKDTHIKHGAKGDKEATIYGPGDEITLTEKEAAALGASVSPAHASKEKAEESEAKAKK